MSVSRALFWEICTMKAPSSLFLQLCCVCVYLFILDEYGKMPLDWTLKGYFSPTRNLACDRHVKSESEVAQSCPTVSDPMDCSLPGSSVHGIFQARVLQWVAIAFSLAATKTHQSQIKKYFLKNFKRLSYQNFWPRWFYRYVLLTFKNSFLLLLCKLSRN